MRGTRKITYFAGLLFVVELLALAAWAGTIKEADYPIQYEVMNTAQTGKLPVDKSCSMTLRDQAKSNVAINVWRRSYGSCHLLDSGKVYRGRENQKKNEIELVIPVGDTKARIENWQIVGTADITPGKS